MLARQVLQYAVARGVPGIASLVLLMVYTRTLAPQEYGAYAAALAWILLVKMVIFQWLELSVLRELSTEHGGAADNVVSSAVGLFLILSAIAVPVAAAFALGGGLPGGPLFVAAAIASLIGVAWFELQLAVLQKRMQALRYGLLRSARAVFECASGFGLVFAGLGASAPMLGLLIGVAVASLVVPGLPWRSLRPRLDPSRVRSFVAYGLPLTAAVAAGAVMNATDRVMLASMKGNAAVGLYAAASELAINPVMLVMMVVNLAAYPLALRAYDRDGRAAAEAQLARNGQFMLAAGLPVMMAIATLAQDLSAVFLGESFRAGAAVIVPVIGLSAFIGGMRSFVYDLAFQVTKNTGAQARVLFVTVVVNVALNLALIDRYGAAGAAFATLLSQAVALSLSALLGRKLLRVNVAGADALKVLLAATLAFGSLLLFDLAADVVGLMSKALASGLGYLGLLYALNACGVREHGRQAREGWLERARAKWS